MKNFIFIIVFLPYISFSFSGKGSGTKDDPYQIININQLQELNEVRKTGIYFTLMNNIDASETIDWNIGDHDDNLMTPNEPMGFEPLNLNSDFSFDGKGYIIKNLYINQPGYGGIALFGICIHAEIKRLGIENCEIIGGMNVSSLCEYIENSRIYECYSTGKVKARKLTAGFCQYSLSSKIENCYTSCSIEASEENAFGFSSGKLGWVNKCYSTGLVFSSSEKLVVDKESERITSFFWDTETTRISDTISDDQAFGLPTSEMMKRSTFESAGWDFDSVWCIDEGKSYPKLRVFNKCTETDVPEQEVNRNGISIFPNPATSQIVISGLGLGAGNLEIYNVLGEIVLPSYSSIKSGQGPAYRSFSTDSGVLVDVSSLASGIYYISMKSGGEHILKQFAVAR